MKFDKDKAEVIRTFSGDRTYILFYTKTMLPSFLSGAMR